MAPKRAAASPIPAARRSSRATAGAAPARLGENDGFGEGKANDWKSPTPKSTPAKKAAEEAASNKGFSIVGPSDVLVMVAAVAAFVNFLPAPVPLTAPSNIPVLAALAATVSTSHLLYAFVWYKSKAFKKYCKKAPLKLLGKHPVAVFGNLVLAVKTIQQLALLTWACGASVEKLVANFLAHLQSPLQLAVVLGLLGGGQVLNVAIYKAIGKDGVYYGFKLGRPVAWSTAFPFSAGFRHPQYVGGFASQLGVLLFAASPTTLAAGLVPLAAYWGLCYIITSIVEASDDNDGD